MAVYDAIRNQLVTSLEQDFPPRGQMLSLDEWQTHRNKNEPPLKREEMIEVVERAHETLEGLYVHIDLKRARRGVDPLNQLRVFRDRLATLAPIAPRAFHDAMLNIFKSLGDVHTAYRLPEPYISAIAFLPFLMNVYFDNRNRRRYLVTHVLADELACESFGPGVEIVSWNGTPIDEAVHLNTDFEEGSNEPHDLALALQFMTVRWLGASYEPDSPWVFVGYQLPDGRSLECKFLWSVFVQEGGPRIIVADQAEAIVFGISRPRNQRERAVHVASQVVHAWCKKVFSADKPHDQPTQKQLTKAAEELVDLFRDFVGRGDLRKFTDDHASLLKKEREDEVPTLLPLFFEAQEFDGATLLREGAGPGNDQPVELTLNDAAAIEKKKFGYIRIRAFAIQDPERGQFQYEFTRLLSLMPGDGLIIDVRDNPGGSAINAEESLQYLTPRHITPISFRFIASAMTKALASEGSIFEEYGLSIDNALVTGGAFSAGRPITNPILANSAGQYYFGPVVLITSATTYSAADIFAAGFQDNDIGSMIGVDETTGAGGANAWFYKEEIGPLADLRPLPAGINLQVAVRQCTRQGETTAGLPIEEAGVSVLQSQLYRLRKVDIDPRKARPWGLLLRAVREIASANLVDLETELNTDSQTGTLTVQVVSKGIDRLDFYVNGRPTARDVVGDAPEENRARHSTQFPLQVHGRVTLEIRGFANQAGEETLVARQIQVFDADSELARAPKVRRRVLMASTDAT